MRLHTLPRWSIAAGCLAAALWASVAAAVERKTLEECIALALDQHPSLKAASASVDAAGQRVWQVASGYFPQVSAGYSAERRKTSVSSSTGTVDPDDPTFAQERTFNFYDTGVGFSQLLFDFGQTLKAIRSAQASQRSIEADRVTTRDQIVFNVKQSYYHVLATRRLLDVADDTVRQTTRQLEEAEGRHGVGLAPRFDVTRAEVQLANAKLNQVTARNNVAVARETLRNALGLTGPLDFDVVDTLDAARLHISEQEALDAAYANRPELRSLAEQQQAVDEQIASLQRQYLPSVSGSGSYNFSGSEYPLQDNWNIGGAVTWQILSGGLTRAQIAEARANLAALRYNEERLRQDIALQVRQAVLDVQRAEESIAVSAKGAQEARENLELAQGRYGTGVGNIIELTDAQAARTTAEATYVQTLVDFRTSVAALERATGRPVTTEAGLK
jgi:outer membrane protein TolC